MLITVTTTSQSLNEILTAAQIQIGRENKELVKQNVFIQNLGTQDIFLEFGNDSAVASGIKIAQDESFSFADTKISDLNLISDTSNNIDVRVALN